MPLTDFLELLIFLDSIRVSLLLIPNFTVLNLCCIIKVVAIKILITFFLLICAILRIIVDALLLNLIFYALLKLCGFLDFVNLILSAFHIQN